MAISVVALEDVTKKKNNNGKLPVNPPNKKSSERLEFLLKLMDDENLQELEISDGDVQVRLVRQSAAVYVPQPTYASAPSQREPKKQNGAAASTEKGSPIISPLAGIFYRASSPKAVPFAKEGDVVTPEKTLCIIEAMKVLNEINAGVHGRITQILVENGKPVQSGQALFMVEPAN